MIKFTIFIIFSLVVTFSGRMFSCIRPKRSYDLGHMTLNLNIFVTKWKIGHSELKCVPPVEVYFSCQSNSFPYERFCTGTRFETEAQGDSKLSLCLAVLELLLFVKSS